MKIGEKIKQIRLSNDMTQNEFSSMLKISRTHITNIENNVENPSKSLIKLISIVFNVDENWLANS